MIFEGTHATLYYEKTGWGPPVVLLHGNGETHEIFDRLTGPLSAGHTVYAVDSRGHGKSSAAAELHYEEMAEDVAELIEGLALEQPALYGFSDGGILGLLIAVRRPGLLSRLVVSGANTDPSGLQKNMLRAFKAMALLTHSPRYRLMSKEPQLLDTELSSISIPVLVLAGEYDLVTEEHTRAFAARLPNGTLRILPGETHGSYVVHSEKLFLLLREFLD